MKNINGCYLNDFGFETQDILTDQCVSIGCRLQKNYKFNLSTDPSVPNLYIVKLYVEFLQKGKESYHLIEKIFARLNHLNYNNSKDSILFLMQEEADSIFNTFLYESIKRYRPEFDMSSIYYADEQLNDKMRSTPILKHLNFVSQSDLAYHVNINHNIEKDKIFLSFNRRLKQHRIMLIGRLIEENLISKSLISFFPNCEGVNFENYIRYSCNLLSDEQKYNYYLWLKDGFILDNDPETVDKNYQHRTSKFLTSLHQRTYFSLICETRFHEPEISVTEKTYKAIAHKHPFLIIGNANFLKYLRSLGYKTFHPLIDESYDNVLDHRQRFEMVIKEIKRLSNMSKQQLNDLWHQLLPILEYNYHIHNNNFEHIDKTATTVFSLIHQFENIDHIERVKISRANQGILKLR